MKSGLVHKSILLFGVLVFAACLFLFLPRKSHFPELPIPNGYVQLAQEAGKVIQPSFTGIDLTSNQLAGFVTTNEAAVIKLRKALTLPSIVPVQFGEAWVSLQHTKEIMNLRAAARAMDAEAMLYRLRGEHANSLELYLDQLRLGNAMMRGGVLIDYLVGSAVEASAASRITNLLSNLTPEQCKHSALVVTELEGQRDDFDEFDSREKEWQRKSFSVLYRIKEGFREHVLRESNPFAGFVGNPEEIYNERTLEVRRLLLKLGSNAFRLEKGHSPSNATQLVPDYLKEIPLNPQTKRRLVLQ